jgi:hypothetical protein
MTKKKIDMTPKEKAEELFAKYLDSTSITLSGAKRCALIAVDEILENFGLRVNGKDHYCGKYTIEFYQEVRKEIEKL